MLIYEILGIGFIPFDTKFNFRQFMIQKAFTWKLKNSNTLFSLESHFTFQEDM